MRRRRSVAWLVTLCVLIPISMLLLGCPWDDDEGGGGKTSKFVFVANTNGDSISTFKIESDGTLTALETVPLAEGRKPTMIALRPDGKYLYVVNSNAYPDGGWNGKASIGVYSFNSSTGAIAEIAGSPFSIPPDASGFTGTFVNEAITPNGKYLYVTDMNSTEMYRSAVHIFEIVSDGTLSFMESVPLDFVYAHGIAMHPSGKFLFVGSYMSAIYSLKINTDGTLTPAPNSPVAVSGTYVWLSVTPNGKYLYGDGVDYGASLSINTTTGELTLLRDPPISTPEGPKSSVVTPSGKFYYSGQFDTNDIFGAKIASDGSFDPVPGSAFPAGSNPKSVTVTRNGKYLYVANYNGSAPALAAPGGRVPRFLVVTGTVGAYKINSSTGELEFIDEYGVGAGPKYLTTLP